MRAGAYPRVSSGPQEQDGTSLDTQLAAIEAFCAERGWKITEVYREVKTGVKFWERPALQAMLSDMEAGKLDVIVFYSIDRLSREPAHLDMLKVLAERYNVDLACVTEPIGNTDEDWLVFQVRGYAAKRHWRQIRESTMRGRRERARSGKLLPAGRALYGYQWRDSDKAALDRHPDTSRVVERIFALLALGHSLRSVCAALITDGVPTPTGRGVWRTTTIRNMVKNPAYYGEAYAWCWRPTDGKHAAFDAEHGYLLPPGVVPPIVDTDVWQTVQRRLAENRRNRPVRNDEHATVALLRGGYCVCGYCGRAATVHQRSDRSGFAYRCGDISEPSRTHPGWTMATHTLDAIVWDYVSSILREPDCIRRELARMIAEDRTSRDLATVDTAIRELERQRDNLSIGIAQVTAPSAVAALSVQLDSVAGRLAALEREREIVAGRMNGWRAAQQRVADLERWCRRMSARIEQATWEEQRLAIDALGVTVTVWRADHPDHRYTIQVAIPLEGGAVLHASTCSGAQHRTIFLLRYGPSPAICK